MRISARAKIAGSSPFAQKRGERSDFMWQRAHRYFPSSEKPRSGSPSGSVIVIAGLSTCFLGRRTIVGVGVTCSGVAVAVGVACSGVDVAAAVSDSVAGALPPHPTKKDIPKKTTMINSETCLWLNVELLSLRLPCRLTLKYEHWLP
jgi:hypothetical protein